MLQVIYIKTPWEIFLGMRNKKNTVSKKLGYALVHSKVFIVNNINFEVCHYS